MLFLQIWKHTVHMTNDLFPDTRDLRALLNFDYFGGKVHSTGSESKRKSCTTGLTLALDF